MINSTLATADRIIESIDLIPVWRAVSTSWRSMTPGAIRSTGESFRSNRAFAVDRLTERVDDAANECVADRY